LKQTGFNPKTDIYFMPVSGYTGANIKDRSSACPWYSGPSLLEYLDDLKTLDRKFNAPLMIPIAEKYKVSKPKAILSSSCCTY
jgi:peptide chain release factor subunit 3